MFNSDNPITSRSEDELGRDGFCKHFAKSILSYNSEETLTIGLFGEWGSGKTSIINLTIERIEAEYIDDAKYKPIIINFNPWNFSDQNNLVHQFFKTLSQNLKRKEYGEVLNKVGESIEDYSIYLEPITFTLTGFPGFSILIKSAGKSIKNFFSKKIDDLESIKKDIDKKLSKIDKKIIIILDDMDRLTNSEIRQIFQLVKSLADFPNVVYILSFDLEIVCEALKEIQKGDGNGYIEKIIQVPIEVPMADKSDVYNLLFKELDKTLINIPDDKFDNYYWGNIFNLGINDFFTNTRDVKRFVNIFRFGFHPIKDEVNPVDFLIVTTIQIFLPALYKRIKNNKELFVSESKKFLDLANVKDVSQEKKNYEDILNNIPESLKNGMDNIIKRMFPKIELLTKEQQFSYSDKKINEWLFNNRICHPDKFDLYFSLTIGKYQISEVNISNIINNVEDIEKTKIKIDDLIKSERIAYFLSSIYARLDKIDRDKLDNISKLLLNSGDLFLKNEQPVIVIINKILRTYNDKDQLLIRLSEYIASSENGLYTCIKLVDYIGLQQEEDSTIAINEPLLELEKIGDLEKILCTKIEEAASDGSLLLHEKLPYIFFRWKKWGGEIELKNYLEKIQSNDMLLVKFISGFTHTVNNLGSSDVVGKITYDLYYNDLLKLIDAEEAYKKIQRIKNVELYKTLNEKEKMGIEWFEKYVSSS